MKRSREQSRGGTADRAPAPWGDAQADAIGAQPPASDALASFRSVGFTISTTGYAIAKRFKELLAPSGLEPREFAILRAIGAEEGRSQQAIGERLLIPASRMVAFVDALEDRGLVQRRQNPTDRRARALHLTSEGRKALERAFACAMQHESDLTSALSAEERRKLLDLLDRVAGRLGVDPAAQAAHSALADE